MEAFLVVLNILAFIVSFGAIVWAWCKVRKDMRSNAHLLGRLEDIAQEYRSGPHGGSTGEERLQEKHDRQVAAGKTMFTNGDMENMPEMVKHLIYTHAASGLGLQVALVGLGLLLGTVANVLSLCLPMAG